MLVFGPSQRGLVLSSTLFTKIALGYTTETKDDVERRRKITADFVNFPPPSMGCKNDATKGF